MAQCIACHTLSLAVRDRFLVREGMDLLFNGFEDSNEEKIGR